MLNEKAFPTILNKNGDFPTGSSKMVLPHITASNSYANNSQLLNRTCRASVMASENNGSHVTRLLSLWSLENVDPCRENSSVEHLRQHIDLGSNGITCLIHGVLADWVSDLDLCIKNNDGHHEKVL